MATRTVRFAALTITVGLLEIALAAPALGGHGKTPPAPAVSKQTLGAARAAVDFCSSVDRGSGHKYEKRALALLPGVSSNDFAKAQSTSEYKAAYKTLNQVLGEMPKDVATKSCAASL